MPTVIDSAPSTGTPVRGGLTLREGDFICECIHETGCLVAMDLVREPQTAQGQKKELMVLQVEVNLLAGEDDLGARETIRAGCSLVRCALGEILL